MSTRIVKRQLRAARQRDAGAPAPAASAAEPAGDVWKSRVERHREQRAQQSQLEHNLGVLTAKPPKRESKRKLSKRQKAKLKVPAIQEKLLRKHDLGRVMREGAR